MRARFLNCGDLDFLMVAGPALATSVELGRFLDPIADKLLVASVLMMLVAFQRVDEWGVLPALVILCREILLQVCGSFWRA